MQRAQISKQDGEDRWVLLIAGPTASGKSALAMQVALHLDDPIIVNADSMQIYEDLRILTARPTKADEGQTSHQLFGNFSGKLPFSVARWREEVGKLLKGSGKQPLIFVGGTGLYFRALIEGLSPVPPVPDSVRNQVRARMEEEGSVALHSELDQHMADQLSPTDSQRVARALEVLLATGKSLADWQAIPPEGALVGTSAKRVVLAPPRDWLEARIAARADQMLGEGAQEEVRRLRAQNLSLDLPVMRAIGVRILSDYLDGNATREEALQALIVETRRYAKRQETWFRGQMGDWPRLDPSELSSEVMARMVMEMNPL